MADICRDAKAERIEFNPEQDHVHLMIHWGNRLWSPSYFAASCGGAPLEIVKQYIANQKTPAA